MRKKTNSIKNCSKTKTKSCKITHSKYNTQGILCSKDNQSIYQ
jgi:hypothetical protein